MSAFRIIVGISKEVPPRDVVIAIRGIVVQSGEYVTEAIASYATPAEADDVCVRLAWAYQCPAAPIGPVLAQTEAPPAIEATE